MRLSARGLQRVVKGDPAIESVPQQLELYSGQEFWRGYQQQLAPPTSRRGDPAVARGDSGSEPLELLIAARLVTGARRLGDLRYLPADQLPTAQQRWFPVVRAVTGSIRDLNAILQWNLALLVIIYFKHLQHRRPKNSQPNLFTPDDGHFDYSTLSI